jgi:hypothetical protein
MEEPTEAAMEEPTEAVAEEPTEEVAAEPTEEEGPAPAAEEQGTWCAGTDIVFFPGGSPGGPFATVVYNGALQAEADLGPNVEYVWSDWNPENMVNQLSEAIATLLMVSPSWGTQVMRLMPPWSTRLRLPASLLLARIQLSQSWRASMLPTDLAM